MAGPVVVALARVAVMDWPRVLRGIQDALASIRSIIQRIRRIPSGSIWIDGAPQPEQSRADQIDVEHQPTDLVATPEAGARQLR
jgi:hypothetical protein